MFVGNVFARRAHVAWIWRRPATRRTGLDRGELGTVRAEFVRFSSSASDNADTRGVQQKRPHNPGSTGSDPTGSHTRHTGSHTHGAYNRSSFLTVGPPPRCILHHNRPPQGFHRLPYLLLAYRQEGRSRGLRTASLTQFAVVRPVPHLGQPEPRMVIGPHRSRSSYEGGGWVALG